MDAHPGLTKAAEERARHEDGEGDAGVPPTQVRGEDRVLGKVAGSTDAAPSVQGRRTGRRETEGSREASPGGDELPAEHPVAAQGCASAPLRDDLSAERPTAAQNCGASSHRDALPAEGATAEPSGKEAPRWQATLNGRPAAPPCPAALAETPATVPSCCQVPGCCKAVSATPCCAVLAETPEARTATGRYEAMLATGCCQAPGSCKPLATGKPCLLLSCTLWL